jgi:hypothetical protein
VFCRCKEEEGGVEEEWRREEEKSCAVSLLTCPSWGPSVIEWSQTCHRMRSRASASGGRPEQSKKQGAAMYVYTAPPSSSS